MTNWRKQLEEIGGYDNELIGVPAGAVRKMIDEIESLRAVVKGAAQMTPVAEIITRWPEGVDLPEPGFRILTPLKEGTKLYRLPPEIEKEMAGALETCTYEGYCGYDSCTEALAHWKELDKS
jgi:hypothetical protein